MEQPYSAPIGMPPGGGPPPKNWLVESILVTIFCCLPLGIVAIINSANVNSRLAVGDYTGAQEASAAAGKWVKYALFGGLEGVRELRAGKRKRVSKLRVEFLGSRPPYG